jgi:hypothetical protein
MCYFFQCSCGSDSNCFGLGKLAGLLDNAISFFMFYMTVCLWMQYCQVDGYVGANSLSQRVLVCSYENLSEHV